jgi:hypothetical protein
VHPKFVQELLGRATIALTLNCCSHSIPSIRDQTARAMEVPPSKCLLLPQGFGLLAEPLLLGLFTRIVWRDSSACD